MSPVSERSRLRLGHLVIIAVLVVTISTGCRRLPEILDAYAEAAHQHWGFNGVVAVVRGDRTLLLKGYGEADTLFADPNTSTTKFFIGSITKQFTAAAILRLYEKDLLDLSDPITVWLSDYPRDPGDRITIHHLLTHTSGIPNYTENPEIVLRRTSVIQPSEIIASFRDLPLDFEPGTRFKYSNSGYVLLGEIIEQVTGQSYEAFLHKEILKPLGMLDTGYGRRVMGHPSRARGYTVDEAGRLTGAAPIRFSILHSAGALYSTAEDLVKWDRALREGTLLSRNSLRLMLTPHSANYGYGWWLERRYDRIHSFHGGFLDGFNSTLDRWLEDSLLVLVLSNDDEAPVKKIARGLAAIVFGKRPVIPIQKQAIEIDPANLKDCVGMYRSEAGEERFVVLEDDTLHTYLRNEPRYHIHPEAPDKFFFAKDNTETLTFRRGSGGEVSSLVYSDGESSWPFDRVDSGSSLLLTLNSPPLKLPLHHLEKFLGTYWLDMDRTGANDPVKLSVDLCGDYLCASVAGNTPVMLWPRGSSTFFHHTSDFSIEFTRDPEGTVTGCVITLSGARVHGRLQAAGES